MKKELPWKAQPWWELEDGWRVHLNPNSNFGRCWNKHTGQEQGFDALRTELYGDSPPAWVALIETAIAHGLNKQLTPEQLRQAQAALTSDLARQIYAITEPHFLPS